MTIKKLHSNIEKNNMCDDALRRLQLEYLTDSPGVMEELLAYNRNHFDFERVDLDNIPEFPFDDEAHVAAWQDYKRDAGTVGVFESLRRRLPQLNFPIQQGISEQEYYRSATLRGLPAGEIDEATGLFLASPDQLELNNYETPAGRIPLLITSDRSDFEMLVRALSMRNEPGTVPASMGAMIIKGYNNWDRINRLKQEWLEKSGSFFGISGWSDEFSRIKQRKELYQDCIILLSTGYYSAIEPQDFDLDEDDWRVMSLDIRREHECTHYFTFRLFGSMKNHLHDELIADFMGLKIATGSFRASWFQHFMGLGSYPDYRDGGRLQNYRGNPPLSDEAFNVLQVLVKKASDNLQQFDEEHGDEFVSLQGRAACILTLARITIEILASPEAVALLNKHYSYIKNSFSMNIKPGR